MDKFIYIVELEGCESTPVNVIVPVEEDIASIVIPDWIAESEVVKVIGEEKDRRS